MKIKKIGCRVSIKIKPSEKISIIIFGIPVFGFFTETWYIGSCDGKEVDRKEIRITITLMAIRFSFGLKFKYRGA